VVVFIKGFGIVGPGSFNSEEGDVYQTNNERLRLIREKKWGVRLILLAGAVAVICFITNEEAKECAARPEVPCQAYSRH